MKSVHGEGVAEHLVSGALIVALGSVIGLWLPANIALTVAGLAVLRLCWIEDNIHQDLLKAKKVPVGYRNTHVRRSAVLNPGAADDAPECPRRLAAQLRIQAHAWSALSWSIAGGLLLAVSNGALLLIAGTVALAFALRGADRMALCHAAVVSGRPIDDDLIAEPGMLRRIALSTRTRD